MNTLRFPMALALALLLWAPLGAEAANSEFEGEWVLDPKRSEGLGQLRDANQTVSLEGENLRVERTIWFGENEPETFDFVYLANGQLHKIVGPQEFERDVTAEWKGWGGKKLEVKWTFEVMGFSIDAVEIWEIKKAGLRLTREFDTPRGKREQKVYFVRPGNKKR